MGTPNCQCFWHKNDAKNNQYFIFPILGGHSGSQLISKANAPLLLTTSIFMSKTLRSKCPYFSWIQCFVYNRWERWIAQSICTHHSCFNHGSVCDPEKNQVQDMNLKKAGCKETGSLLFKNKARLPLLFLNHNDTVFCSLLFSGPYFRPDFFWAPDPEKILSQPDKLE